ncbi:MAG: HAD-IA family hydrolase [Minisyncoccia bacterium]|jgi:putative hydrolase of the HAD superfamily
MNRFKAVVFDFGGVIELNKNGSSVKYVADALSIPVDELRKVYFQYNHLANVHNMTYEDVMVKAVRTFDKSEATADRVRELMRSHKEGHTINTNLFPLFSALRRSGYKVAILSNNRTDLRQRLEKQHILPLVDEVVISVEIGHQKPDKEAFDAVFRKLGVRPEEVVFVDDIPKSLEKASEIGYHPILFSNNDQLRADLEKLGIWT